jgi:hypothetical protein
MAIRKTCMSEFKQDTVKLSPSRVTWSGENGHPRRCPNRAGARVPTPWSWGGRLRCGHDTARKGPGVERHALGARCPAVASEPRERRPIRKTTAVALVKTHC